MGDGVLAAFRGDGDIADRKALAPDVIGECRAQGWNALVKMVQPWPVSRHRTPPDLITALTQEAK